MQVSVFSGLGDAQIQKIAQVVIERQYKQSDVIIRKGDVGDALYIVKSGAVKCKAIGKGDAAC